jgi:glycosyltransferase involved in cell wall biosynthesis
VTGDVASEPVVSVLLPARNAAETIDACLDSISAQTLVDHEVLVVDDGSADGTATRVAAHAAADSRVRLLRRPCEGLVPALTAGLRAARAPLVARMDGDDLMRPGRLARQVEFLARHPEAVLVGCRVSAFPDAALGSGMREYLRWQNSCLTAEDLRDERYVESPLVHPSVTFRRDVVMAAGGYRDGPFPEDYELWLRLARRGAVMGKVDEVLLDWRQRADSLSRRSDRYDRTAFDHLRARFLSLDPRIRGERPLVYWGAGRRTRKRSALLAARGRTPSALVDVDPRKIGNRLAGVSVVAPEWLAGRCPRPFVLGYVTSHGARDQVAGALQRMGYARGRDYLMVG